MVKCLTHGLRGFNGAVQRRLATLTLTMLISLCWQLSSEVELRRIFDACKRWANSGSHEFVKKNMVRYMRPHGRFAHCIFTLAVRQPPVLASCIEIYYFHPCVKKKRVTRWLIPRQWMSPCTRAGIYLRMLVLASYFHVAARAGTINDF